MNASDTLKSAPLYTDGHDYLMIHLPPRAITAAAGVLAEIGDPFGAMIADKDEVTLIIPAETYADFQSRLRGARLSDPLRLITFDAELPPDLTGFMALIAKLLAEAKIPIIPIGAFARDHILVKAADFDRAWQVLEEAQRS